MEGKIETMAIDTKSGSGDESEDEDVHVPSFLLDDDDSDNEVTLYDIEQSLADDTGGGESKTYSLVNMYAQAFPKAGDPSDIDNLLLDFQNNIFDRLIDRTTLEEMGMSVITGYLRSDFTRETINAEDMSIIKEKGGQINDFGTRCKNLKSSQVRKFMENLIIKDYSLSLLNWGDFVQEYQNIDPSELAVRILGNIFKEAGEKVCVDSIKKERLLKCISYAIRVGLNYQELEQFEAKVPVSADMRPLTYPMTLEDVEHLNIPLYELTDEELTQIEGTVSKEQSKKVARIDVLELGMKLPEDPFTKYIPFTDIPFKKVNTEDMWKDPHWKGMCSYSDLPDGYVSEWNIHKVFSFDADDIRFFVNPTKRKTLQIVRSVASNPDIKTHVEGGYDVDLDNLSAASIARLCKLKTLKLAPRVLKAANKYFKSGADGLEESYRIWKWSTNSYKLYKRDDLKPAPKPFFTPEIKYTGQVTVEEIISGDLSKLAGLISLRNNDDHDAALHRDPPVLIPGAPDVDFQRALTAAFEQMGFLPTGYDIYCGVKRGEPTLTRERSESEDEPAKRQRNLFTAIEIH